MDNMKVDFINGTAYHEDSNNVTEMLISSSQFVDLVLTDPPYGISYFSGRYKGENPHTHLENDDQLYINVERLDQVIKDSGALLFFFSQKVMPSFPLKDILIWVKNNWSAGDLKKSFGNQYEMIGYLPKDNFKFPNGRPSNIFFCDREKPIYHPTQKPVELIIKLIKYCSNVGDVIYDPFAGSGTTAIACIKTGRKFIVVEKNEKHFNKLCKRIEQEESQIKLNFEEVI